MENLREARTWGKLITESGLGGIDVGPQGPTKRIENAIMNEEG